MLRPCYRLLARYFCTLLLISCWVGYANAQSLLDYQTVALTGQNLPGASDGAVYSLFSSATLNANGQVAFATAVADSGGGVALVSDILGPLSVLARTGESVPGITGGATYSALGDSPATFQINNNGQFIFSATIEGTSVSQDNDEIVFSNILGTSTPVLREGVPTQGFTDLPNPGSSSGFAFDAALTDQGALVYTQLSNTGDGSIVLSQSGGVTSSILQPGSGVSGGDQQFSGLAFLEVLADGGVQISAGLSGNDNFVTSLEEASSPSLGSGLFVDRGDGLETVALPGQSVPSGEPNLVLAGLSNPRISGDAVVFDSRIFDDQITEFTDQPFRQGVFQSSEGQFQSIASSGDIVTLEDETRVIEFASLIDVGAEGQILYQAVTRPENADEPFESRFISFEDGVHRTIALGGSQVPDLDEGVLFGLSLSSNLRDAVASDSFLPEFTGFLPSSRGIGGDGQIVFTARLAGDDVNEFNNEALFVEVDGQLQLLAREGDLFDLNDDPLVEDLRTLSSVVDTSFALSVFGSSLDAGGSAFNDSGQLIANFEFTDGTEGIFVFDASSQVAIPEPTNVLAGAFALVAFSLRRRGR